MTTNGMPAPPDTAERRERIALAALGDAAHTRFANLLQAADHLKKLRERAEAYHDAIERAVSSLEAIGTELACGRADDLREVLLETP